MLSVFCRSRQRLPLFPLRSLASPGSRDEHERLKSHRDDLAVPRSHRASSNRSPRCGGKLESSSCRECHYRQIQCYNTSAGVGMYLLVHCPRSNGSPVCKRDVTLPHTHAVISSKSVERRTTPPGAAKVRGRAVNDSLVKMSSSQLEPFPAASFKAKVKREIIIGIILAHGKRRERWGVRASTRYAHFKSAIEYNHRKSQECMDRE